MCEGRRDSGGWDDDNDDDGGDREGKRHWRHKFSRQYFCIAHLKTGDSTSPGFFHVGPSCYIKTTYILHEIHRKSFSSAFSFFSMAYILYVMLLLLLVYMAYGREEMKPAGHQLHWF